VAEFHCFYLFMGEGDPAAFVHILWPTATKFRCLDMDVDPGGRDTGPPQKMEWRGSNIDVCRSFCTLYALVQLLL